MIATSGVRPFLKECYLTPQLLLIRILVHHFLIVLSKLITGYWLNRNFTSRKIIATTNEKLETMVSAKKKAHDRVFCLFVVIAVVCLFKLVSSE